MNKAAGSWLVFLVIAGSLIGLLRWKTFSLWPGRDAGIFAYIGWELAEYGGVMYHDWWDHKPPFIHYLNATLFQLFGPSRQVMAAFEMIWLLGLAGAFRQLGRLFFNPGTGWWLAFLFLVYGGGTKIIENYGMTETYALLPALLAFAAMWQYTRGWHLRWAFLAGVFVATAGLFRPVAAGVGLPVLLGLVWVSAIRGGAARTIARSVGMYLSGVVVMLGAVGSIFALAGAAADFWSQVIAFNQLYSSGSQEWLPVLKALPRQLFSSQLAVQPLLLALAAIGFGVFWVLDRQNSRERRALGTVLISWALVELLILSLGGRYYEHYFYQLLGPLVLLSGYVLQARSAVPVANSAVAIVWLLAIAFASPLIDEIREKPTRDAQRVQAVDWVMANTTPDDRVYFWGAEAELNFITKRRSLSPYAFVYPLEAPQYTTPAMLDTFLESLQRDRPLYIIDTSQTNPAVASLADGSMKASDDIFSAATVGPVIAYIQRHYTASEQLGEWAVYKRK